MNIRIKKKVVEEYEVDLQFEEKEEVGIVVIDSYEKEGVSQNFTVSKVDP